MGVKKVLKTVGVTAAQVALGRTVGHPDAATTLLGGGMAAAGTLSAISAVLSNPESLNSIAAILTQVQQIIVQIAIILGGLGLMKTKVGSVLAPKGAAVNEPEETE